MKIHLLLTMVFTLVGASELMAQLPDTTHFVTTWKTDNPGTSNSTSITIPTNPGLTYNYDVDWDNDGTFDEFGISGNITHSFGTPGIYTIRIMGTFPRIDFRFSGDNKKILRVDQWGNNLWTSMEYAFLDCTNLQVPATDAPDLSGVISMHRMFQECDSMNSNINHWDVSSINNMSNLFLGAHFFNQPLDNWDVGNVTNMHGMFGSVFAFNQDLGGWDVGIVMDMSYMFAYASSFNQDISTWNTENVTDMSEMFQYATGFDQNLGGWDVSMVSSFSDMFLGTALSTTNYDSLLIGWGAQAVKPNLTFSAGNSLYCAGAVAKQYLIDQYGWTITDDGLACTDSDYFVSSWMTDNLSTGSSNSTSITIPTFPGEAYYYDVDWSYDGVTFNADDAGVTGNITHDYGTAGTYKVAIRGAFPRIYFNLAGDRQKLLSVDQWGATPWTSMQNAFFGCNNMTVLATDTPDFTQANNLSFMFGDCSTLNANLSSWDVSQVTDFTGVFYKATSFNGPLNSWEVHNATKMPLMFYEATSFDQDISSWDMSKVENAFRMFFGAMSYNQDMSDWNLSQCTILAEMFLGATAFNGDIKDWVLNTDAQVTMELMFAEASNFNQNISGWQVDSVNSTLGMFKNAVAFNQPIGTWNVGNVFAMNAMFYGAVAFNQDLGSWDVHEVIYMDSLFSGATAFNKDISSWNVSNVSTMKGMFSGVFMDQVNYDKLLKAWSSLPLKDNVLFDAGNSVFCSGANGRQYLIDHFGWTINDEGLNCTSADEFVTKWKTNHPGISNSTSITIPTFPGAYYNYDVDWDNNGTFDSIGVTGNITHNYGIEDTVTIRIRGAFPQMSFSFGTDSKKLLSVDQWGSIAWTSMNSAFGECSNMNITAMDAPDLSNVSTMEFMFRNCTSLDADLNGWDVSQVTNFLGTFYIATSFNGQISNWNVSNAQNMFLMFFAASSFNQPINDWAVDSVKNMRNMFFNASSFNQPLNDWTVDNVRDMGGMFYGASSFDQPLDNWSMSNVCNTNLMFAGATSFNQSMPNWDLSSDTMLIEMFHNATAFNGDIGNWTLNSSAPVNMARMFETASSFDRDIGAWNVGKVTDMSSMFYQATSFNQDIGSWQIDSVTNLANMFNGAIAFDQDLGDWNILKVTDFSGMFTGGELSPPNYDSLLIGWASQLGISMNVSFDAGSSQYCAGESARNGALIGYLQWTITDGGKWPGCNADTTTFDNGEWNYGPPTASKTAIVLGQYNSSIHGGSIDAREMIIEAGGSVTITSGHYLIVFQTFLCNGALDIQLGAEGPFAIQPYANP